ncbi:hypothetical protein cand_001380 [Cryptosporidium andersoni]|uniref:Uncharacterized protein n=1 Tax=Cryptosporidium andersoni TaxID=117008 RepID=A0A1J4MST3_9CRYT|nr:hypothetical protein cand_001380 [Cryptosporidium andersoni]
MSISLPIGRDPQIELENDPRVLLGLARIIGCDENTGNITNNEISEKIEHIGNTIKRKQYYGSRSVEEGNFKQYQQDEQLKGIDLRVSDNILDKFFISNSSSIINTPSTTLSPLTNHNQAQNLGMNKMTSLPMESYGLYMNRMDLIDPVVDELSARTANLVGPLVYPNSVSLITLQKLWQNLLLISNVLQQQPSPSLYQSLSSHINNAAVTAANLFPTQIPSSYVDIQSCHLSPLLTSICNDKTNSSIYSETLQFLASQCAQLVSGQIVGSGEIRVSGTEINDSISTSGNDNRELFGTQECNTNVVDSIVRARQIIVSNSSSSGNTVTNSLARSNTNGVSEDTSNNFPNFTASEDLKNKSLPIELTHSFTCNSESKNLKPKLIGNTRLSGILKHDQIRELYDTSTIPEDLTIPQYSPGIKLVLGEAGRELLRACIRNKGMKGKDLQNTSITDLLKAAHENDLWLVAIKIHLEHRGVIPMSAIHSKWRKHKSIQNKVRRQKRERASELLSIASCVNVSSVEINDIKEKRIKVEEHNDEKLGCDSSLEYYPGIVLRLGHEGRKALIKAIRGCHEQSPESVNLAFQKNGISYSQIRNATVSLLLKMSYLCGLWDVAVKLHHHHMSKKKRYNFKDIEFNVNEHKSKSEILNHSVLGRDMDFIKDDQDEKYESVHEGNFEGPENKKSAHIYLSNNNSNELCTDLRIISNPKIDITFSPQHENFCQGSDSVVPYTAA